MPRYDVNADWVDPFEPPPQRRSAERFRFRIKLSITVDRDGGRTRLVGPGIVKDLSLVGAYLVTKHDLSPGQRITVAVPTKHYPIGKILPAYFVGPAEVVRVEPDKENRIKAAIKFGDALTQNMDFAVFINSLQEIREAFTKFK